MRSVCNAWCTSYRLHEIGYQHVYCPGCKRGPDKLAHYLVCQEFWKAVFQEDLIVQGMTFEHPLSTLGIVPWRPELQYYIAIITIVYHNFKHTHPAYSSIDALSFNLAADCAAARARLRSRRL